MEKYPVWQTERLAKQNPRYSDRSRKKRQDLHYRELSPNDPHLLRSPRRSSVTNGWTAIWTSERDSNSQDWDFGGMSEISFLWIARILPMGLRSYLPQFMMGACSRRNRATRGCTRRRCV